MEKTARHFLSGADLGEGAVFICVEINLERFLVRPDIHLGLHTNSVAAISDRRKCVTPAGRVSAFAILAAAGVAAAVWL